MLDEDSIYELDSGVAEPADSAHQRKPQRSMPLASLERIVFANCNQHFNLLLEFHR